MHLDDIRKPRGIRYSPKELEIATSHAEKLDLSFSAFVRLRTIHETVEEQVQLLISEKQRMDTGARMLSILGRESYASNLNQIAKSLNCGTHVEILEVQRTVDGCLVMLQDIRREQMLLQGLRKI